MLACRATESSMATLFRRFSSRNLLLAAVIVVPAALALGAGSFESTDGDLVSQGGVDWAELAAAGRLLIGQDTPSGQSDDALQGKEDDLSPDVEFGSIPNNKSDLLRFYVSHESIDDGNGSTTDFLYLAWV